MKVEREERGGGKEEERESAKEESERGASRFWALWPRLDNPRSMFRLLPGLLCSLACFVRGVVAELKSFVRG